MPREGSRDIQQKGKIISVPYDWCKSQSAPVPYKIWAWQANGANLANTVRQTDCRSHVLGSIVDQCYGDEPGTGGGVKSGTHNAECTPLSASPTVRAEGKPMVRYLDKWWMNHKNTWGCLNNSQDISNYNSFEDSSIQPKLQVAQLATPAAGPAGAAVLAAPLVGGTLKGLGQGIYGARPDSDDTISDFLQRPINNINKMMGKTKVDVGGKVQWVRITPQDPKCPLCKTVTNKLVASGTWGYSPLDNVPANVEQHGILGPHHNLWLANQIPHPDCRCQWTRQPFAAAPGRLPYGAIPWEPFVNTP